jgi:ABC-type branched-subunit amino acid transport system permease subunit
MQYYVAILLVYAGISIIACWGLDLQFGETGIPNFAFIVFQALGAYTAAVLTLGKAGNSAVISYQQYVLGFSLPFPIPIVVACIVGALASFPVGLLALRRLRSDYLAIALLVLSLIATVGAEADVGLVNGSEGLYGIPEPFGGVLSSIADNWLYVGITGVAVLLTALVVRRIVRSPLDRVLRAIRDNEVSAGALGKNVPAATLATFVVGNTIAAGSGAILVQFIGAWSPSGWEYAETFVYLSAIIIGGRARRGGVALGAVLLGVGISEGVRYLPQFGGPALAGALQFLLIGLLIIGFLWWRPNGILPERKRLLVPKEALRDGSEI